MGNFSSFKKKSEEITKISDVLFFLRIVDHYLYNETRKEGKEGKESSSLRR